MKKISRIFLFGALTLVLLTAACTEATATTIATSGPIGRLASATALADMAGTPVASLDTTLTAGTATPLAGTATTGAAMTTSPDSAGTPGVPVTGADLVLLECQYCIQGMAHALLVLPDTATFETIADTASGATPGPDTGCNTVDTYNGRQVVICRGQENTSMNLNICTDSNNCTQLLVELQSCPVTNPSGATNTPEASAPTSTAAIGVTDTPGVASTTPTP